jgi:hypothetical protein
MGCFLGAGVMELLLLRNQEINRSISYSDLPQYERTASESKKKRNQILVATQKEVASSGKWPGCCG